VVTGHLFDPPRSFRPGGTDLRPAMRSSCVPWPRRPEMGSAAAFVVALATDCRARSDARHGLGSGQGSAHGETDGTVSGVPLRGGPDFGPEILLLPSVLRPAQTQVRWLEDQTAGRAHRSLSEGACTLPESSCLRNRRLRNTVALLREPAVRSTTGSSPPAGRRGSQNGLARSRELRRRPGGRGRRRSGPLRVGMERRRGALA
jgi:hypothetical protein